MNKFPAPAAYTANHEEEEDWKNLRFISTHDEALDLLQDEEILLIFDFHDDRKASAWAAAKAGIPFHADEANWVIKGECTGQIRQWFLIHPEWQPDIMEERFIDGPRPVLTISTIRELPDVPVVVSICFDYFLHKGTTGFYEDGSYGIFGRRLDVPENVLEEEALAIFKTLREMGVKIKSAHAAESRSYVPESRIRTIRTVLQEAWDRNFGELSA